MDVNHNLVLSQAQSLADSLALDIVDCDIFYVAKTAAVRCLVEAREGAVTIDQCAVFNKAFYAYLEQSQLLGENFSVEVNSPGVGRKLKSARDFSRFIGRKIMLWLKMPFNGKDYHEGVLRKVSPSEIVLDVDNKLMVVQMEIVVTGKEKVDF